MKARKTKLAKYGDEFYTNREKINKTNLKKYGNINPLMNEEVLEKRNNTMIEKYGVLYTMQNNKLKKKVQNTNIERYGKPNSYNPEKAKITKLEKYGDENYNNRELAEKTCIERYKRSSYTQTKEFNSKIRKTCLRKYGTTCYLRSKDGIRKSKETNLRKYGCEYYGSSDKARKSTSERKQKEFYDRIIKNSHLELLNPYDEFKNRTPITKLKWKCLDCGCEFEQQINKHYGQTSTFHTYARCPTCHPREYSHSKSEKEILNFIKEKYSGEIINGLGSRKIIYPLEIDIYIPELKLGIEYDGLYWHSELCGKDKDYHVYKTNECEKIGIKLIHIFSDEWENNKETIKDYLLNEIRCNKFEHGEILNNGKCYDYLDNGIRICSFYRIGDNIRVLSGNINGDILRKIVEFVKYSLGIKNPRIILDRRFYSIFDIGDFNYKIRKPTCWYVSPSIDKKYSYREFRKLKDNRSYSKIWDCGYFEIII